MYALCLHGPNFLNRIPAAAAAWAETTVVQCCCCVFGLSPRAKAVFWRVLNICGSIFTADAKSYVF
jgi:hypothetical protein